MIGRAEERHPHLLAWYVAGALKPAEAREVRDHLDGCGECRRAADGLAAMVDALSRDADPAHVGAEDLVRYETAGRTGDPDLGRRVEAHLLQCASCRQELALLRRLPSADASPGPTEAPSRHQSRGSIAAWLRRPWHVAAGLAAAHLIVALNPQLQDRRHEVIFSSPRRADTAPPRLTMPGPWSLKVMLPFSAPRGAYRARVESQEGSVVHLVMEQVSPNPDGALSIPLASIDRPGSYKLILEPSQEPADVLLEYPFVVAPPPG